VRQTVRAGFWNARQRALTACIIELGLVFLVAMAGAQKPNVVTVQRPSLAVYLSLLPGSQESELKLRVRTKPPIKIPPKVEFQDTAGGTVRAVKIEADGQGAAWVGRITSVNPFGVGYIHVTATTDSGLVERHALRFAIRATVKNQASVMQSLEGQFAFAALPGDLPAAARFLITTHELPDPPLPAGVKLEAGPFQIMATQQISGQVKANVAIFLTTKASAGSSPSYQVRWLKPAGEAWQVLPTTIGADGSVAQAAVSSVGTFVLTSESK
jgi:hypothetical protein